jgi:ketosteroid isomerase-like protein
MKPALTIPLMSDQLMSDRAAPEIELLHAAYAAFNARDIDAALALMTPDVAKAESVQRRFCPWT